MPASFDHAFELWLTQHGNEKSVAVNVLEFAHSKWGRLFVSDFGDAFTFTTEAAEVFTALPLGFVIDAKADNVSTEQRVIIRLDNANGAVVQQLRTLTEDDLASPESVIVTWRVYLDTNPHEPVTDPLSLLALNVQATRPGVECEASANLLPNVGAGIRYTLERFPSLAYL